MIKLTRQKVPDELQRRLQERGERLRELLRNGEKPPQTLSDWYRDPALKEHLIAEAHGKCVYCESKIIHLYFGDIEHFWPKSKFPEKGLDLENLGLACARCNNAKGDFWDENILLLNPYVDEPDHEVFAHGVFLKRRPGRPRALLTIKRLDLNRPALVERRMERIELLESLADQYANAPAGAVKDLIRAELLQQAADESEYAIFVRAYIETACGLQWDEEDPNAEGSTRPVDVGLT
jgi:5-methylcytosine-specific restriction endonuclease McrA